MYLESLTTCTVQCAHVPWSQTACTLICFLSVQLARYLLSILILAADYCRQTNNSCSCVMRRVWGTCCIGISRARTSRCTTTSSRKASLPVSTSDRARCCCAVWLFWGEAARKKMLPRYCMMSSSEKPVSGHRPVIKECLTGISPDLFFFPSLSTNCMRSVFSRLWHDSVWFNLW